MKRGKIAAGTKSVRKKLGRGFKGTEPQMNDGKPKNRLKPQMNTDGKRSSQYSAVSGQEKRNEQWARGDGHRVESEEQDEGATVVYTTMETESDGHESEGGCRDQDGACEKSVEYADDEMKG